MAASKTAAPAKKAVKKAAAPKAESAVPDNEQHYNYDRKLAAQVVKLRDKDGKKWDEIAEIMESTTGKVLQLYVCEITPESEKIKGSFEKRANAIAGLRADGYSWAQIVARVDLPESRARSEFEDRTGEPTRGNRVGRGGRYPKGDAPELRPRVTPKDRIKADRAEKAAKRKATKAAPPPKESTNGAKTFQTMTLAELRNRLDGGVKILVELPNGNETMVVQSVKSVRKGDIKFITPDGDERTVLASSIRRAATKKELAPA